MKVAIGPLFYESGGVARYILGVKNHSSHNVSTIPPTLTRRYIVKSARAIRFYKNWLERFKLNHYDVVHSQVDPWFINLCQSSRSTKCKWVHTYHTLNLVEDGNPEPVKELHEQINKSLIEVARNADKKISVAKWVRDYLLNNYSIESEIVPNGVDVDTLDAAVPDRFVEKFRLREYVLFVGYFEAVKNPLLFVKLAEQMPKTNFVMIGIDAADIISIYGKPKPNNLFLIRGLSHKETIDAISACKTFVMTSKLEGCPTALMEAMGLEKHVVVPNHSGCKEVVQSEDYGFLYEPDSLEDLVEKTRGALASKDVCKKARERVLQNYDWKIVAKQIDKIYESCK